MTKFTVILAVVLGVSQSANSAEILNIEEANLSSEMRNSASQLSASLNSVDDSNAKNLIRIQSEIEGLITDQFSNAARRPRQCRSYLTVQRPALNRRIETLKKALADVGDEVQSSIEDKLNAAIVESQNIDEQLKSDGLDSNC